MAAPTGEPLRVPVALIIFNRPEKTRQVFESIARQRPTHLFVIADGPRRDHVEDIDLVKASRSITEAVDWPCEVTRLYSVDNLGCRRRMITGLDHVFDEVPRAIVLEDDCVPHEDFFTFAAEMLDYYADDERIFSIGGHIWEFPDHFIKEGYFLSKYFSAWGWATWSDRWKRVDPELSKWPSVRRSEFLQEWADGPLEIVYWERVFDLVHAHEAPFSQVWDYGIQFSMWLQGMLTVRPCVNLVRNVGFDREGTHTLVDSPAISGRMAHDYPWPIIHPAAPERDRQLDTRVSQLRFGTSLKALLKWRP